MRHIGLLVAAVLLCGPPAGALTDEEVFRDLRFNLINPGARSLALGGAFISLAEDATAAQANPAGLSVLKKPEYFAEIRSIDNSARSSVFNESIPSVVDTFTASGTDINDVVSMSFLSVVTVYDRWAMGLSRQEVLNIDNATLNSLAFTFPGSPGAFLAEGSGSLNLDITNLNVSAGVKITDEFRIGGTLTLSRLNAKSQVENKILDTNGAFTGGTPYLTPTFDLSTTIDDSDEDVVYSLGILYKRDRWGLGAVYRRGPRFSVLQQIEQGLDVFNIGAEFPSGRMVNRFSLPDTVGIGGHVQLFKQRQLTLAASVERLRYSNLLDGYIAGVNLLTDFDAVFKVDDANDYRAGAEYLFLHRGNSLQATLLRIGAFAESDTTIEAESTGSGGFASPEVFRGRGTLYHATFGIGFKFKRWTVDAAADLSEADNEYVVSVIYQGKR